MRSSAFSLRLAGAAFLLLAFAAPAAADEPSRAPAANEAAAESGGAAAEAPARPAAKPREERKFCRVEDATGSNLRGKKICLTARQWRDRQ